MTHPANRPDPASPAPVGPALYDVDDSDAVVARILSSLSTGRPTAFTPARLAAKRPLPRRTPGVHLDLYGSRREAENPPVIRRNPASIANTSLGCFQGWRRGHESIHTGGMIPAAALAAPAGPLPAGPLSTLLGAFRRRQALRPTAVRLVGLVVRFLPTFERSRYSEEFRAELSGLTGWQQLGYAIRLALSAPALRRSLGREPVDGAGAAE